LFVEPLAIDTWWLRNSPWNYSKFNVAKYIILGA
jgi:hypothetical protein